MKNAPFFDSGRFAGSFVLFLLIAGTLDNFIGGHNFGILAGVIATVAIRLLWMWVEGSNVTITLWGQRLRLTVASLFVCAGAFLAVSFMFSGIAWLATSSTTKGNDSICHAKLFNEMTPDQIQYCEKRYPLDDSLCYAPTRINQTPDQIQHCGDIYLRAQNEALAQAANETRIAQERLSNIQHPKDRYKEYNPKTDQTCTWVSSGATQRVLECHKGDW